MTAVVRPMQNPAFYTASAARCRSWIDELAAAGGPAPSDPAQPVGGIVPHAGWRYSGRVAARVWQALARARASTVIIFGAVHYPGIDRPTAYPAGVWETPLGPLPIDEALAARLEAALGPRLRLGARAHEREHSIEVQIPFVKALGAPGLRFLPIAAPPGSDCEGVGRAIGELTRDEAVVAVGSTDLTHYGERYFLAPAGRGPEAEAWMQANDRRMVDILLRLDCAAVEPEAAAHHNACGPGAAAAALAFAKARGARCGCLLEQTTSHQVEPEGEFETAVGYAGIVF